MLRESFKSFLDLAKVSLIIISLTALGGCSILTPPKENPVIEDHAHNWFNVQKIGTLSTTAERREVIFKFPGNQFCAEPSPDVAEALTSSLNLMAKASVDKTNATSTDAQLQFGKELATSIRNLFPRTQGAQFFRDGVFNLCQSSLNGTITPEQYFTLYKELVITSSALIKDELSRRPIIAQPAVDPDPVGKKISIPADQPAVQTVPK